MKLPFLVLLLLNYQLVFSQNNIKLITTNQIEEIRDADFCWKKLIKNWSSLFINGEQLGCVDNLVCLEDHIVIWDEINKEKRVQIFDTDGKYLFRLGISNKDTKQYVKNPGVVLYHPVKKEFYLFDGIINKVRYVYNNQGELLDNVACSELENRLISAVWKDDHWLCSQELSFNKTLALFTLDENFKLIRKIREHNCLFTRGYYSYSTHTITDSKEESLVSFPFCDTVFQYHNNQLVPYYILKINSCEVLDKTKNLQDYIFLCRSLEEKGIFQRTSIFNLHNQIWMCYSNGTLVYNKKRNNGYFIPNEIQFDSDMLVPLSILSQKDNKLITAYTQDELLSLQEEMKRQNIVPNKKLETIFQESQRGEKNRLLIVSYHLR